MHSVPDAAAARSSRSPRSTPCSGSASCQSGDHPLAMLATNVQKVCPSQRRPETLSSAPGVAGEGPPQTPGPSAGSHRLVLRAELNFAEARQYRKKRTAGADPQSVEVSRTVQLVRTMIGDNQETSNTANPGDFIVTGIRGERYVLTPEKFHAKYERDPDAAGRFRSKRNVVRAIAFDHAVKWEAPWGQTQWAAPGARMIEASPGSSDIYLIDGEIFEQTYEAVG